MPWIREAAAFCGVEEGREGSSENCYILGGACEPSGASVEADERCSVERHQPPVSPHRRHHLQRERQLHVRGVQWSWDKLLRAAKYRNPLWVHIFFARAGNQYFTKYFSVPLFSQYLMAERYTFPGVRGCFNISEVAQFHLSPQDIRP